MTTTGTSAFRRPMTAQQAVLAELRRTILAGDLPPGAQIVQDALAERLGVSRVPVREALRILEGEGQISYAPHRGYFVAELSLEELLEIRRIRELLEPEAVRAAVPRLDGDAIREMRDAFQGMQEASDRGDIGAMNTNHTRFHFTLFERSGMPRLVRILQLLSDMSDPYRAVYHGDEASRLTAQQEHAAILELTENRDPQGLVELLDAHRQHTVDRLKDALGAKLG